jgi:hypothetical protein
MLCPVHLGVAKLSTAKLNATWYSYLSINVLEKSLLMRIYGAGHGQTRKNIGLSSVLPYGI